jgi:fucose 4-O-acetylase-like acetyltransferase
MFVENQHHNNNILLVSSLILNVAANLTKSDITFILGVIVSLLAIANYIIQITKTLKGKNAKR